MKIDDIVQRSDTKAGRAFDLVVLSLIVISIVLLFIEDSSWLPERVAERISIGQLIITVLFTIEYVLRIATAPRKRGYIFSFFGWVDLLCILPFYLSFIAPHLLGGEADSSSVIRSLRMLRIFSILKIGRYNKALTRFGKAFNMAKYELVVFLLTVFILISILGVGISCFESHPDSEHFQSTFDGLWWAVSTLTTVGSDVSPQTVWGKLFTTLVVLCGLGLIAVPSGIIAASLAKVMAQEEEEGG